MKRISHNLFIPLRISQDDYETVANGFMLIELIVATLIASILSGVLLTALYQSARVQASIDTTIDLSERVGIVYNQLEKDLAGAFVPESASAQNPAESDETSSGNANESSSAKTAEKQSSEKAGEKQKKPIEKIFYATNKDGMLDTLTFVTNNPLVIFVGKDVGYVKPKVVRVQYSLRPEQDKKGSYTLFRQEANEIDLGEFKNARPYEVIGGIKKLSATYTARIEKSDSAKASSDTTSDTKQEKPSNKTENKKKSYEYKVQPDWISEQKKETNAAAEKDKKEPEFPRIPYNVEFKMTLWDKQENKDKEFTLICHIPVDSIEAKKKDKKERKPVEQAPPKSEEDNKSKPQGQNNPAQNTAHNKQSQSGQKVVYNEIEIVSNALDSLKKLLGHM